MLSIAPLAVEDIQNHHYLGLVQNQLLYGQSDSDQLNSNTTNFVNMQDIPLEKVRVGDIEVAYKMFGKGDPILLFNGASDNMDAWDPPFLTGYFFKSHSDYV
ncbi:MAG: hypothetical protein ACRD8Z_15030 [Nitrososphaeraceae archaeon]